MIDAQIIPTALAYAQSLDALHMFGPSDVEADALDRVGELLGGLSVHGFYADLKRAMECAYEDGVDGQRYAEMTWFASDWLLDAQAIMLPVLNGVRNTALLEDLRGWRAAA